MVEAADRAVSTNHRQLPLQMLIVVARSCQDQAGFGTVHPEAAVLPAALGPDPLGRRHLRVHCHQGPYHPRHRQTCPSAWASSSAARMCLLSASPARWSIKGHCVPPGHCINRVTKLITRPHTYHPLIRIVGSLSLSLCNMLVCSHGLSHCVRRCVKHACHAQCSVDQVQTCSDVRVITDLYVIE